MSGENRNIAGKLTRKALIWSGVIVLCLSYFIFSFAGWATREFYTESYHNKMLVTYEYTRRVLSDVYVAVTNNIYYLEQHLDDSDYPKGVMERIVHNGTRVRSCGISFIEDYYYPERGHRFCPFAWRNSANPDIIYSENMGDADLDYLVADWFLDVIKADTAVWSDPFYDGYDNATTLAAYMVPIHEKSGRAVAVLGADVSLDWLTDKLHEMDSTIDKSTSFLSDVMDLQSQSFIINHDGTFITHPESGHILKENFFKHFDQSDDAEVKALADKVKGDVTSERESSISYDYDGNKCYLFYTPLKYTQWTMVTVVPSKTIGILGFINGFMLLLIVILFMLIAVAVYHYFVASYVEPL